MNWFKQLEVKIVLTKLWSAMDGYKTHTLAVASILVALIGHFWGPVTLANGIQIPHYDWNAVFGAMQISGFFSFLHMQKQP